MRARPSGSFSAAGRPRSRRNGAPDLDGATVKHRNVIVIGASAGGVEVLTQLVGTLPSSLDAAVFVTLHFPAHGTSVLPRLLSRAGPLETVHPADDAPVRPGRIYVAPPDHHMLVFRDRVRLVRGPPENGNRPALDPMFRSAALAHGSRVVGVVLTGNLDDGTSGLMAVKRRGGIAVVQDPTDAMFPSMPASALEHVRVDHVVSIGSLGPLLAWLVGEPRSDESPTREAALGTALHAGRSAPARKDRAGRSGLL